MQCPLPQIKQTKSPKQATFNLLNNLLGAGALRPYQSSMTSSSTNNQTSNTKTKHVLPLNSSRISGFIWFYSFLPLFDGISTKLTLCLRFARPPGDAEGHGGRRADLGLGLDGLGNLGATDGVVWGWGLNRWALMLFCLKGENGREKKNDELDIKNSLLGSRMVLVFFSPVFALQILPRAEGTSWRSRSAWSEAFWPWPTDTPCSRQLWVMLLGDCKVKERMTSVCS